MSAAAEEHATINAGHALAGRPRERKPGRATSSSNYLATAVDRHALNTDGSGTPTHCGDTHRFRHSPVADREWRMLADGVRHIRNLTNRESPLTLCGHRVPAGPSCGTPGGWWVASGSDAGTPTGSALLPNALEVSQAVDFARSVRRSVIVTLRSDGRPQLSNVLHLVADDGSVVISTCADRAKYRNLVRRPWAALHLTRDDFFAYAVLEGEVTLTPPAALRDDAVVDELVDYNRAAAGEHDDWDAYREAMVAERRAIVRVRPTYAYGMLGRPDDGDA